ncbi:hypothetical protein AAFF_G00243840 [Aldrovandia affinis]|uniref:Uncharacterized protein n=1 Tax=Aldrovandia affinis TaxID=143900 RepID=A0AAD7W3N5_9TELE|nr:hypothetical protein AAFF_G00243840 [Aldrovandia affinis]
MHGRGNRPHAPALASRKEGASVAENKSPITFPNKGGDVLGSRGPSCLPRVLLLSGLSHRPLGTAPLSGDTESIWDWS